MAASVQLSLTAMFDELCRYHEHTIPNNDKEFLRFAKFQEDCRKRWLAAELEAQRLQRELSHAKATVSQLEMKNKHSLGMIREGLEERERIKKEKSLLEQQVAMVRDLLFQNPTGVNDETREKLAFLNSSVNHRYSRYDEHHDSPLIKLGTIQERNSTASVLSSSDMSFDMTEDDLDASNVRSGRPFRKRRSTDILASPVKDLNTSKRRRSSIGGKVIDARSDDHLVATTTVTVTKGGPITATSSIEARNSSGLKKRRSLSEPRIQVTEPATPSAPPKESLDWETKTPMTVRRPTNQFAHNDITPVISHSKLATVSSASKLSQRPHTFATKTVLKVETCMPCGKRIKFGSSSLRCHDCRAICHVDCKSRLPLPCIPAVNTPCGKGFVGVIADYAPSTPPMIPALIVHCVNEVERRGLSEVGLYRVPGSEREIKELKDRFLRCKGQPNLSQLDIMVVCGTMKAFLRSLHEPLITYTLWSKFIRAAEASDCNDAQNGLYAALSELPQPNRDTLAFLILHLQRIAECPEVKMPLLNLAKVFGPTLVGYSSADAPPMVIMQETPKQQIVMERLLTIESDYWSRLIDANPDGSFMGQQRSPVRASGDTPKYLRGFTRPQVIFASPSLS